KRVNDGPFLAVHADGTVQVGAPFGPGKPFRTKIPVKEVQALLDYAVKEKQFFQLDAKRIQAEIEKDSGGGFAGVIDASDTVVRVRTAEREHEVRFNALGFVARQYPKIERLVQLNDVAERLERLLKDCQEKEKKEKKKNP